MASRDVRLTLDCEQCVPPQEMNTATTVAGSAIDLAGSEAALVLVETGAATTAPHYVVQESDASGSGFTAVAESDLIGVTGNAAGVTMVLNTVAKVSYVGSKRYVKVAVTSVASAAAFVSVSVVRAHLRHTGPQPV